MSDKMREAAPFTEEQLLAGARAIFAADIGMPDWNSPHFKGFREDCFRYARLVLAEAAPSRPATAGADLVENLAQWLHDETGHPDSYPDYTWPETDRDDGQREGGFVKIVPQHGQAYFRDIARRLVARFTFPDPAVSPQIGLAAVVEALAPFANIAPFVEYTDFRDGSVVHRQYDRNGVRHELIKDHFRAAAKAYALALPRAQCAPATPSAPGASAPAQPLPGQNPSGPRPPGERP